MTLQIIYSVQRARWELVDEFGTLLKRLFTWEELRPEDIIAGIENDQPDFLPLTERYPDTIAGLEPHHDWWVRA